MDNARVIRKLALVLLVVLLLAVPVISAEYWGSARSDKYHYPTCRWDKKILTTNLVVFSSPEDARAAGYIPCKVCKPPR